MKPHRYSVRFTAAAVKQLKKMDPKDAKRILDYMEEVERLEDPFSRGSGLVENLRGLWRYRVGDWRILCEVVRQKLLIHVMYVGHRRDVYSHLHQ